MSKWSETLQENTLQHVFYGAVMKDESHNFGIVSFDSIPEMINAGWVMD